MAIVGNRREPPMKAYGVRLHGVVFLLIPAIFLAPLMIVYRDFYSTQLLAPFDPVLPIVVVIIAALGVYLVGPFRPSDPLFPYTKKRAVLDRLLLFSALALVAFFILSIGLDGAERLFNKRAFAPKDFSITGIERESGNRMPRPAMIKINPYDSFISAEIAIPRAQFDELNAKGIAGQCITLPARKAIFAREHIRVGCLSGFCTHPRATVKPCSR